MWPFQYTRVVKRCALGHRLLASSQHCPRCDGPGGAADDADLASVGMTVIRGPASARGPEPAATAPGAVLRLIVESGDSAGRVLELTAGTWKLGRTPRAQEGFQLLAFPEDRAMSREHAVIEVGPSSSTVRDSGSTNGVYVNDARIERHALRAGDRVRLGDTTLSVRLAVDAE